jgi:hypothetical protein
MPAKGIRVMKMNKYVIVPIVKTTMGCTDVKRTNVIGGILDMREMKYILPVDLRLNFTSSFRVAIYAAYNVAVTAAISEAIITPMTL